MQKLMICLTLCGVAFTGTGVLAQNQNLSSISEPTEVGTTAIPSGNYVVTDETTGKAYPLMITTKGTMVLGPAGTATQGLAGVTPTKKLTLQQEVQQGVTNMVKQEGVGQLERLIK